MIPMPAASYRRISTDFQEANTSLDGQETSIKRYAGQQGLNLVADFSDVESGAHMQRPGLSALLELAARGEIKAVVVYHIDRLSRDILQALSMLRDLAKLGVTVHDTTSGVVDAEVSIVTLVRLWYAGEERKTIRRRMQKGLRDKAAVQGKPTGTGNQVSFGYRWRYVQFGNKMEKELEIEPTTADVVRRIYEWFVADLLTVRAIAMRLTELGIPTPRRSGYNTELVEARKNVKDGSVWSSATVHRILTNQTYCGEMVCFKRKYTQIVDGSGNVKNVYTPTDKEEQVIVAVPAIVDRTVWGKAQERMSINAQNSKRNARHEYLLRGRVRCECGHAMAGHCMRKEKTWLYYICGAMTPDKRRACPSARRVRAAQLEEAVWSWVVEQLNPSRLAAGVEADRASSADRRGKLAQRVEQLQTQRTHLQQRYDRARDAYLAGAFGLDEFTQAKASVDAMLKASDAELAVALADLENCDSAAIQTDVLIAYAAELQQTAAEIDDPSDRRWLIDMLDVRVVVGLDRQSASVTARLDLAGSLDLGSTRPDCVSSTSRLQTQKTRALILSAQIPLAA